MSERSYRDSCGIARALDAVGERWALLVVRELRFGPKRFTDLRSGLPRVGPDMLAARLRELEERGVVRRRTLAPPAASRVYELTEWGAELAPVLAALGRWGSRAPLPADPPPLSVDAALVALQTTFSAGGGERYELALGDQVFSIAVRDGDLEIVPGPAAEPVVRIETDTATLAAVLWHGRPLAQARASGALSLQGDGAAAVRFTEMFAAPVPAAG